MRYFEVQFWDEAPSIGSGHRYVFAIEWRRYRLRTRIVKRAEQAVAA